MPSTSIRDAIVSLAGSVGAASCPVLPEGLDKLRRPAFPAGWSPSDSTAWWRFGPGERSGRHITFKRTHHERHKSSVPKMNV